MVDVLAHLIALEDAFLQRLPQKQREKIYYDRKMRRIRDKEENMRSRLERRRWAIWWKWALRLIGFALGLIGIPLFLALLNQCWLLILN